MCQKLTNILGEWAIFLRHPNRIHVLDTEQIRRSQAQLDARREEEHSQQKCNETGRIEIGKIATPINSPPVDTLDYEDYSTDCWFGGSVTEPVWKYEGGSL